jgi:hypothetical protein
MLNVRGEIIALFCGRVGLEMDGILVEADNSLKISDFSRAAYLPPELYSTEAESASAPAFPSTRKQLSLLYTTPEYHLHKMDPSTMTDIWTLGIILYSLVAGFMPFDYDDNGLKSSGKTSISADHSPGKSGSLHSAEQTAALVSKISDASYFPFPTWFSEHLNGLLGTLLTENPYSRLSLAAIENHAWTVSVVPDASDQRINESSNNERSNMHGIDTPVGEENNPLCAVVIPYALYVPMQGISSVWGTMTSVFDFSGPSSAERENSPSSGRDSKVKRDKNDNINDNESDFDDLGHDDHRQFNSRKVDMP